MTDHRNLAQCLNGARTYWESADGDIFVYNAYGYIHYRKDQRYGPGRGYKWGGRVKSPPGGSRNLKAPKHTTTHERGDHE